MILKHVRSEWDVQMKEYCCLYRDHSNIHFIISQQRWDTDVIEQKLNNEDYKDIDYICCLDLLYFDRNCHTPFKSIIELEECFKKIDYETFTEIFFLINFPLDMEDNEYDYSDKTTVLFQKVFGYSEQSQIDEPTQQEIEKLNHNKQTLFNINMTDNIIVVYFLVYNKDYNRIDKHKFAFHEEYLNVVFDSYHPIKFDILDNLTANVITQHFYTHFINFNYYYDIDLEIVKKQYIREYLLEEIEKLDLKNER